MSKISKLIAVPSIDELDLKEIKALIFDMDGTLLNSEILHARALIDLLKESNVEYETLLEEFRGVAEPDIFLSLKERGILSQELRFDDFVYKKNEVFKTYLLDPILRDKLLDPKLLTLIIEAKNRGLKIALVTASEKETTEIFFNTLVLNEYFNLILTREDTPQTKPHPDPYLNCFKKLGLNFDEVIIFEDSVTGIESAKLSKAKYYEVSWYY